MLFHTCHCCPCISARGHNFYHLQWDFFCINLKLWLGRFLNMDFTREPNKRLQVRWSNIWVIHYFQKRYKGINVRASFVLIQFVHYKELVQSMIQFNLSSQWFNFLTYTACCYTWWCKLLLSYVSFPVQATFLTPSFTSKFISALSQNRHTFAVPDRSLMLSNLKCSRLYFIGAALKIYHVKGQ